MPKVQIEDLLTAGAHFGHLTRRWNPQMRPYIFMERNGIHIIDLKKTQHLVDEAHDAAERIATEGKRVLFVGTKKQARDVVRAEAERIGANFVTDRWLGGMLTNFATIRKSIKRLQLIEKMENDGTADNLTKKERLMLSREKEKLVRVMGGIADMNRLPGALYIVDIRKEHLAVKEAKTLGIPVIAIVDTNTDPRDVDFPIPANDDSLKTIALITKVIADGVANGREVSKAHMMEEMSADDREMKEGGAEGRDDANVRTRRRTRSRRGDAPAGGADATGVEGAATEAQAGAEGAAESAPVSEVASIPPAAPPAAPPAEPEAPAASEAQG
ncbi:MAG: 30S ribosomal protein S2 [Bacteroidetes bacterium]|nr:30S ribosomal protein S2 [Bacteroidota bacterium]